MQFEMNLNYSTKFHKITGSQNFNTAFYLKYFFDITYYLGLCPFRLVLKSSSEKEKRYKRHQWGPQKLYSLFVTILCCLWLLREAFTPMELQIPGEKQQHPKRIFGAILKFFGIIGKVLTIKNLWADQDKFQKIVNYGLNRHSFKQTVQAPVNTYSKQCIVYLAYLVYSFVGFIELLTRKKTYEFNKDNDLNFHLSWWGWDKISLFRDMSYVSIAVSLLSNIGWFYR